MATAGTSNPKSQRRLQIDADARRERAKSIQQRSRANVPLNTDSATIRRDKAEALVDGDNDFNDFLLALRTEAAQAEEEEEANVTAAREGETAEPEDVKPSIREEKGKEPEKPSPPSTPDFDFTWNARPPLTAKTIRAIAWSALPKWRNPLGWPEERKRHASVDPEAMNYDPDDPDTWSESFTNKAMWHTMTDAYAIMANHQQTPRVNDRTVGKLPARYDGKERGPLARSFIVQNELYHTMNPNSIVSDVQKVQLAVHLLDKDAAEWALPIAKELVDGIWRGTWASFKQKFQERFDALDTQSQAYAKFLDLKQRNRPFADFLGELEDLATRGRVGISEKMNHIKTNISEEIKDLLIHHEIPMDYQALVALIQRLDVRAQERLAERKRSQFSRFRNKNTAQLRAEQDDSDTETAELRATEDRECYNCRKKGHLMKDCPDPLRDRPYTPGTKPATGQRTTPFKGGAPRKPGGPPKQGQGRAQIRAALLEKLSDIQAEINAVYEESDEEDDNADQPEAEEDPSFF